MSKPNYPFWDLHPEYTLQNAAFLCCDVEPGSKGQKVRQVSAMGERLKREKGQIPHRADAHWSGGSSWMNTPPRVTGETLFFTRQGLREWAERTEQRILMPFLFPEDRKEPVEPALRPDSLEALNSLIGLLAHAVITRGGPDFGPHEKPKKAALIRAMRKEAEALRIGLGGLSDSQLNDRLDDAFKELANRKASGL